MTRKIIGEKRISKTGKPYYNYYQKKQKAKRGKFSKWLVELIRKFDLYDRIINWYWKKRIIEPDARED